jgi:methylmalonyl-CoA/ethylmalonyl-CoA epimerase
MFNKDCFLDHVAIAVSNLDSAVKIYEDLGLKFSMEREIVESQGVETAFAHVDSNAHIELLRPTHDESPIKKFIDKNGEGIHHLCFKVPDVHKKCEELKNNGYRLIYEKPVPGANNCLVNFIHPKSSGGVLIELSQSMNS